MPCTLCLPVALCKDTDGGARRRVRGRRTLYHPFMESLPPVLTTERLLLRPYVRADRDGMLQAFADPAVAKFMSAPADKPDLSTLFERVFEVYAAGRFLVWAVAARKDAAAYLGHAELKVTEHCAPDEREIVYLLHPAARGQGYAHEVVTAVTEHAATLGGVTSVIGTVDPDNAASIRVMEKAGYAHARTFTDDLGEVLVLRRPLAERSIP